jgi:hypothetical protein
MPKKKSKAKKGLAIAGAIILGLSGITKLIKDNASEKHAAVVAANERYTSYLTQSTISLQILLKEVQDNSENNQRVASSRRKEIDYTPLVKKTYGLAEQFQADYVRNFDEISKLIDVLPANYTDLRARRDILEPLVKQNQEKLSAFVGEKPNEPATVNEATNLCEVTVQLDIATIKFGDKAMWAADETIQKQDESIKSQGIALNILVPLAAVLGLVAAFWDVKFESGE